MGGGNGKPLQYYCLENPMNSMRRQKDTTREDEALKSFKLGFSSTKTTNFQMEKLGLEKAEEPRDQIANIHCILARELQRNIYFCFIDYTKAFVWIATNCGKFFKRWEYQTTLPAS